MCQSGADDCQAESHHLVTVPAAVRQRHAVRGGEPDRTFHRRTGEASCRVAVTGSEKLHAATSPCSRHCWVPPVYQNPRLTLTCREDSASSRQFLTHVYQNPRLTLTCRQDSASSCQFLTHAYQNPRLILTCRQDSASLPVVRTVASLRVIRTVLAAASS